MKENKQQFLDINGDTTLVPFNKKIVIYVTLAVLAVIFGSVLPLDMYGPKAGLALGFFVSIVILFLSQCFAIEVIGMVLVAGGFFLGFWDWNQFQAASGASSFLQMLCMMIIAAGANTTPIGKRLALWILTKVGNKPIRLVFGFSIATALISSFISNVATLVLMSSIANSMLLTMGEKPGKSKLGRTLLLIIPAASYLGGIGLINGSPGSNVAGLAYLSSFTNGEFIPTFRQFAIIMYPTMILLLIPFTLVYIKGSTLKNSDVQQDLPNDYFDKLYKKLGPMEGSEKRWLILVISMVVWLLAGGHGTAVPLTIAAICLMPIVGTTPAKNVWGSIPMSIIFLMFMVAPMGQLWGATGLIDAVKDLIGPLFNNLSPLVLSILFIFICMILTNILINAGGAVALPVFISIGVAICAEKGINPGVILLPMIVSTSMVWFVVLNANSYLNFGYGWYEVKDAYIPGGLALILVSIVIPIMTFLLAPLAGFSIYI